MNFQDALVQMQQHQFMVRSGWKPAEGFVCIMPGMLYVWRITPMPTPNAGNFIMTVEDMQASDWILLAEQTAQYDSSAANADELQAQAIVELAQA